jgi:hypothetical protein
MEQVMTASIQFFTIQKSDTWRETLVTRFSFYLGISKF